jgi:hypothetical protein
VAVAHFREITGRTGGDDKDRNKRYTRTFQILTDTTTDGAKQVLAFVFVPKLGAVWEEVDAAGVVVATDPEAFAVDRRADQTNKDHPCDWLVTVEYAGREDPVSEPPEVSWSCVKYQVQTQRDADDVWAVNSAGDPYEGGLTRDRSRMVVTIRKNVLFWDPQAALAYLDTLNEQMFLPVAHPPGFLPGLCKLSDIGADAVWREKRDSVLYWKRTAKVEIDLYGWQAKILDAGFHEKLDTPVTVFGVAVKRRDIMLPGGGKPSSPVPLNGAGKKLAHDGTPVFNQFSPYELADWSLLNIDYDPSNGGL